MRMGNSLLLFTFVMDHYCIPLIWFTFRTNENTSMCFRLSSSLPFFLLAFKPSTGVIRTLEVTSQESEVTEVGELFLLHSRFPLVLSSWNVGDGEYMT